MALTIDNKLGDLLKDQRMIEILDKYVKGASKNPQLSMGKALTIKMILGMPQAKTFGFTKEVVDKILEEVNALPPVA